MKYILQVDGREIVLSEEELVDIVKEHYANKEATEQPTKAKQKPEKPKERVLFEVNPLAIDQTLFQTKRDDESQEWTRQWILDAFAEAKANPKKYGKRFYTLRPEKTWTVKTAQELKEYASKIGDHEADWVEQGFELAQRIYNGETWEAVCNEVDTAPWYRVIIWKNGHTRLVGGARHDHGNYAASDVGNYDYSPNYEFRNSVPLVVLYK